MKPMLLKPSGPRDHDESMPLSLLLASLGLEVEMLK
jgi:hypothetical protein